MPDVSTEVALATTTLSSAASSIDFTSIPATFTDLRISLVGSFSGSNNFANLRYNSDSSSLYSSVVLWGTGASANSSRDRLGSLMYYQWNATSSSSDLVFQDINIFSYAGSTVKTALFANSQDANGGGNVERNVGLWRSTAAITAVNLISSSTWNAGTTATLYGIL